MKKVLLIMLIALFVSITATASAVTIDLNHPNMGVDQTFATVELTEPFLGTFHFYVTTASGFLMKNFYFNTDILTLIVGNIQNISSDGSPAYSAAVDYDNIGGVDGFGKFDIGITKNGEHNASWLIFDVVVGSGTINDFIKLSASPAENGAGNFGADIAPAAGGATFKARDGGTSVPEPSALLLLGSGLLGFALYSRRRFKK
jgi:hypothetical protein